MNVAPFMPASLPGCSSTSSVLNPWRSAQRRYILQQHLGPVLSVGPAGARVDGNDRIAGVVGTGQQHLGLGFFDFAFEPVNDGLQFLEGSLILGGEL